MWPEARREFPFMLSNSKIRPKIYFAHTFGVYSSQKYKRRMSNWKVVCSTISQATSIFVLLKNIEGNVLPVLASPQAQQMAIPELVAIEQKKMCDCCNSPLSSAKCTSTAQ